MSEAIAATLPARPNLNTRPHAAGPVIFLALLAVGIGYTLYGLVGDIEAAHTPPVAIGAFVLLGIALLIALGFEFVNGFHDTANAVATVIYTHSLPAHLAVVWSGVFNFLGVMVSSGAVAFSVLSLLPVELILQCRTCATTCIWSARRSVWRRETDLARTGRLGAEGLSRRGGQPRPNSFPCG